MAKFKKIILRSLLTFGILIPAVAFAHFFIFPQESRSILIDYSNFKKEGHLYFSANTPTDKIDTLQSIIESASLRVRNFWGQKKGTPTFIYCYSNEDFKKYGSASLVPAVTHYKMGPYIVISSRELI